MSKHKLKVTAIKEGTVIDHIPSGSLFDVMNILGLDHTDKPITFGTNFDSKKLGSKAIIKISDKFFEDEDLNKIALIAPHAKLNIIKEYEVVEKKVVEIPEKIEGIAKCFNPKCISNNEEMTTRFSVISEEPLEMKCYYCEKIMSKEQLEIL